MGDLAERNKQIYYLRDTKGLKLKEIASLFNLTSEAVRNVCKKQEKIQKIGWPYTLSWRVQRGLKLLNIKTKDEALCFFKKWGSVGFLKTNCFGRKSWKELESSLFGEDSRDV